MPGIGNWKFKIGNRCFVKRNDNDTQRFFAEELQMIPQCIQKHVF